MFTYYALIYAIQMLSFFVSVYNCRFSTDYLIIKLYCFIILLVHLIIGKKCLKMRKKKYDLRQFKIFIYNYKFLFVISLLYFKSGGTGGKTI